MADTLDPSLLAQDPAPVGGMTEEFLPNVPAQTGQVSSAEGESELGIQPQTKWDKFGYSLKQLSEQGAVGIPFVDTEAPGTWIRSYTDRTIEAEAKSRGSQKISAEEANKRFPHLGLPFTEDVYPEIADLKASEATRRVKQEEFINRGPKTGLPFALGVGAFSIFDPVNLTAGAVAGVAGAAVAGAYALGTAATVAVDFLSNVATNVAIDVPSYYQRKSDLEDVNLTDTAINAVAGAAIGVGVHTAGKALLGRIADSERISQLAEKIKEKLPASVKERLTREAIVAHEQGRKINLADSARTSLERATGLTKGVDSHYSYETQVHPSERAQYSASEAENNTSVKFSQDLATDDSIHLTDSPDRANNFAGTPESAFTGSVDQKFVDESAKIIDIDKSIQDPAVSEIAKVITAELDLKNVDPNLTLRQALEMVKEQAREGSSPSTAIQDIQSELKSKGYDGYQYVNNIDGKPISNDTVLFDNSKLIDGESYTSNRDIVPGDSAQNSISRDGLNNDPTQKLDYSQELDSKIKDQSSKPLIQDAEIDGLLDYRVQQAESELKLATQDDPEKAKELMKQLKREDATAMQEMDLLKQMSDCSVGEIG